MIRSKSQQVGLDSKEIKLIEFGLLVFIAVTLFLKFRLIFQISINQDEFYYLSNIFSHSRGTLTSQFHTFHVHFFGWLSYFSNNEVTQIIIARSVMYLFFLGTNILTYLIGRQFINRSGALFAVICFLSFSFVVVNGSSFRTDTISSFLCLLSIYMITARSQSKISLIIAGLIMTVSLMVTTKSIFHLLTIGTIFTCLLVLDQQRRDVGKQVISFVVGLMGGFFLFYYLHIATLPGPRLREPQEFVSQTYSKVIIVHKLFPGWRFLELSMYSNWVIWILLAVGTILIILAAIRSTGKKRTNRIKLLCLLVPLVSLVFYRNSFPYFYVFILSPAIIVCGVVVHEIMEVFRKTRSVFCLFLVVVLTFIVVYNFLVYYVVSSPDRTITQREVIEVVHEMFPMPVSYIDGCSMVSSFPGAGFFMSSWGMEGYLSANRPIMRNILNRRRPLFLLADVPHLNLFLPRWEAVSATNYALLDEDWRVLKSNFMHHWGPIYVVGKEFEFKPGLNSQTFEILIPGEHTLEGELEVAVNGIVYRPGSRINLKKGKHTITSLGNSGKAALRLGKHLYKPENEPSLTPLFWGPFM